MPTEDRLCSHSVADSSSNRERHPKQIKNVSEWVGKTIEAAFKGDEYVLLRFTDGDYVKVSQKREPYEDYYVITTDSDLDIYERKYLGLISEKEYEAIRKQELLARQEALQISRRNQYEQLRNEFEGT